ncbi:MAG: metallophosphoesterase [Candidatus Aenigmarchaeota archaeon]|nr:metallophosphoesterase [Candidatus Aenigmarchaeota archaeon]
MVKIAFLGDFHFGYKIDERTENDSFEQAYKFLLKAKEEADIICVMGDIFDVKNPTPKVISRAIRVFREIKNEDTITYFKNGAEVKTKKPLIIAIHGNHERRLHKESSPVKILEEAGLVEYLHLNRIRVKNGEKNIDIYGMSSVPEIFAGKILFEKWRPHEQLDVNSFNILLLHQNISPFIYSKEEPSLNVGNLPKEFDLVVDGHIHTSGIQKISEKTTLIISGSNIITRLTEEEINAKRGFFVVDVDENGVNYEFREVDKPREYLYKEISSDEIDNVIVFIEKFLKEEMLKAREKIPVIKIKIKGKKPVSDKAIKRIYNTYKEKFVLVIDNQTEEESMLEKLGEIRDLKDKRVSIDSLVSKIINERLEKSGFSKSFDPIMILELLRDEEVDKIVNLLAGGQSSIKEFWKK